MPIEFAIIRELAMVPSRIKIQDPAILTEAIAKVEQHVIDARKAIIVMEEMLQKVKELCDGMSNS
jgi:hypothetical protein